MRLASVKYITLLLLLITSCVALAQYDTVTIRGNVIDSYTRKPLSGISIINPKSNEPHVTDNRGAFYFNIQKNDTLFLFYPGYKTAKFSVADSGDDLKRSCDLVGPWVRLFDGTMVGRPEC